MERECLRCRSGRGQRNPLEALIPQLGGTSTEIFRSLAYAVFGTSLDEGAVSGAETANRSREETAMTQKISPLSFLAVVGCLALLAVPAHAEPDRAPAAQEAASSVTSETSEPPACDAVATVLEEPLLQAPCMVSVQCADGSSVSCTGSSSCSTSGTNGRCVTCDGTQTGCCPKTCCEDCQERLDECIGNCYVQFCVNRCYTSYDHCASACGGCS